MRKQWRSSRRVVRTMAAVFEAMEGRRLLSVAPVIQSLDVSPASIAKNDRVTLTAVGVSDPDGTVKSVSFYDDTNGSGALDKGDKVLGKDAKSADGFSISYLNKNLTGGVHTVFAQATDNSKDKSVPVSAALDVVNAAPTVSKVTASPAKLKPGQTVTLTAQAKDVDGSVAKVDFYADADKDGVLNPATDLLLGSDSDKKGGWSMKLQPGTVAAGSTKIFAVATDGAGAVSAPASTTITVPQQGVDLMISSLQYSPKTFSLGQSGQKVRISAVVANIGNTTSGTYVYELRLSKDQVWGNADDIVVFDSDPQKGVKGGQSRVDAGTLSVNEFEHTPPAGTYFVAAMVDARNTVSETDETNNIFFSPTADLVITP